MTQKLVDSELLERAYDLGFHAAADWANRDDLHCDTDSAAYRDERDEKLAALDAPQQEADGYIYEYESPFGGVHRELTCRQWNGREPCRTIPYYLHPAPSVPEGWQLVPKEPTWEMQDAPEVRIDAPCVGCGNTQVGPFDCATIYKAMLSAAPKAPTTDDRKDAERWRKARDADPDSGEPYLVRQRTDSWGNWRDEILLGDDADATIDAAMAAQKGEKK